MEAADSSKMLVFTYQTIRCHIPEDCNLYTHYSEQIRFYKMRGFYDRVQAKKEWMECFLHSSQQLYRYGGSVGVFDSVFTSLSKKSI